MAWGYEFFDTSSQQSIQDRLTECELAGRIGCETMHQDAWDTTERVLDFVDQKVSGNNLVQQEMMIASVERVIPWLQDIQTRITSNKKILIAQFLTIGLEDILAEYDYRQSALHVPASLIANLENDILGKKIINPVRQSLIKQLMTLGFDRFETMPYESSLGVLQTSSDDRKQWSLQRNIVTDDPIDQFVKQVLATQGDEVQDLWIGKEIYDQRSGVYLFKNASDLQALGYQVVSHRTRTNTDAEYRRENIATAFTQIGNLRVLNPGQTISYLGDSNFDMQEQQLYRTGKAIFLDEEIDAYGGGLCGGSTALYQGAFLNQALDFGKRNHSKRYTSLYTATINGEKQSTPGIDSTIFSPSLDLTITNTASYPIIMVANYDGTYQGVEEIFTMSPRATDEGSYRFIQSRPRSYTLSTANGQGRAVTGGCYEWEINGELSTRCYKEVF